MTIAFRDNDGTTRLAGDLLAAGGATGDVLTQQADGTYEPAAGGSQPVTCVLEAYPLDVHSIALVPCKWTALFDNPSAFGHLLAIPAGLGLTFSFDGSSEVITTTEAGTWAFTMGVNVDQDATWEGFALLDANLYTQSRTVDAAVQTAVASLTETVTLPSGATLFPYVNTTAGGTANPLACDVYLNIVRLA